MALAVSCAKSRHFYIEDNLTIKHSGHSYPREWYESYH